MNSPGRQRRPYCVSLDRIYGDVTCIRASVHPCIRASVHPCIRASVHPCIRASVHPCIRRTPPALLAITHI
ncbi:hypothetical protein FS834_28945 [Agrobacterium vitis]|nr:hypothetical protein [Allorhizobium ampelinum]